MNKLNMIYRKFGKRMFDLMLLIPCTIIAMPIMIGLAVIIWIKLGSPVIFKQLRPGRNEKPFILYKFRTMLNTKDKFGNLLPNEQRLTKFGLFLRSTSLDELPELLNVLLGEMSFVGPRPLLMEYLDKYTAEQKKRHDLKPGITGWAQIKGRNLLTWEEKFEYDLYYIKNVSFYLDIKVLLITFYKVFSRKGVSPTDRPIIERFKGTENNE